MIFISMLTSFIFKCSFWAFSAQQETVQKDQPQVRLLLDVRPFLKDPECSSVDPLSALANANKNNSKNCNIKISEVANHEDCNCTKNGESVRESNNIQDLRNILPAMTPSIAKAQMKIYEQQFLPSLGIDVDSKTPMNSCEERREKLRQRVCDKANPFALKNSFLSNHCKTNKKTDLNNEEVAYIQTRLQDEQAMTQNDPERRPHFSQFRDLGIYALLSWTGCPQILRGFTDFLKSTRSQFSLQPQDHEAPTPGTFIPLGADYSSQQTSNSTMTKPQNNTLPASQNEPRVSSSGKIRGGINNLGLSTETDLTRFYDKASFAINIRQPMAKEGEQKLDLSLVLPVFQNTAVAKIGRLQTRDTSIENSKYDPLYYLQFSIPLGKK
jgi:hypothetical protein